MSATLDPSVDLGCQTQCHPSPVTVPAPRSVTAPRVRIPLQTSEAVRLMQKYGQPILSGLSSWASSHCFASRCARSAGKSTRLIRKNTMRNGLIC